MNPKIQMFLCLLIGLISVVQGNAQTVYANREWVEESPVVGGGVYYHTSSIVVSGNLVVTGRKLNINGDTDIITTKYNSNGTVHWSQTSSGNFSGGGDDYGIELIAYSNGDIIVIGAVKNNTTNYDYRILRYNASGTLLWSYDWNRSGVNGDDIPSAITIQGTGGGRADATGTHCIRFD